jgi:hypothetical protein
VVDTNTVVNAAFLSGAAASNAGITSSSSSSSTAAANSGFNAAGQAVVQNAFGGWSPVINGVVQNQSVLGPVSPASINVSGGGGYFGGGGGGGVFQSTPFTSSILGGSGALSGSQAAQQAAQNAGLSASQLSSYLTSQQAAAQSAARLAAQSNIAVGDIYVPGLNMYSSGGTKDQTAILRFPTPSEQKKIDLANAQGSFSNLPPVKFLKGEYGFQQKTLKGTPINQSATSSYGQPTIPSNYTGFNVYKTTDDLFQKGNEIFTKNINPLLIKAGVNKELVNTNVSVPSNLPGQLLVTSFFSPLLNTGSYSQEAAQEVANGELRYDYVKGIWVRVNKITGEVTPAVTRDSALAEFKASPEERQISILKKAFTHEGLNPDATPIQKVYLDQPSLLKDVEKAKSFMKEAGLTEEQANNLIYKLFPKLKPKLPATAISSDTILNEQTQTPVAPVSSGYEINAEIPNTRGISKITAASQVPAEPPPQNILVGGNQLSTSYVGTNQYERTAGGLLPKSATNLKIQMNEQSSSLLNPASLSISEGLSSLSNQASSLSNPSASLSSSASVSSSASASKSASETSQISNLLNPESSLSINQQASTSQTQEEQQNQNQRTKSKGLSLLLPSNLLNKVKNIVKKQAHIYEALTIRKKKLVPLGDFLSADEAFKKGEEVSRRTLARSSLVIAKDTGQFIKPSNLPNDFRFSKRNPYQLVQRKALNRGTGEVPEIQAAKRSSGRRFTPTKSFKKGRI